MAEAVVRRADTGRVARPDLHFLGHSTVRVELAGRTVLTDPLLADTVGLLRRVVPLPDPATWAGVDLVLISHLHGDHLHLPSLRTPRPPHVRIVVPRGAGAWLRGRGFPRVDELSAGEALTDGDLRITGVRAEHSGHRLGPAAHPRARRPSRSATCSRAAAARVYASGDTGLFDGMARAGQAARSTSRCCRSGAGVPTSGPGHLDPVTAAEAVALIRPRVAVPVHWGTLAVAGLTSAAVAAAPPDAPAAGRPAARRSPPRSPPAGWPPASSSPSPAGRAPPARRCA